MKKKAGMAKNTRTKKTETSARKAVKEKTPRPGPSYDFTGGITQNLQDSGDEKKQIEVSGLWGSLGRLVGTSVSRRLDRPLLYIVGHIPEAFDAEDDLETFLGGPIELFPAFEGHEDKPDPTSEIACQRLRVCRELAAGGFKGIMAAPIQALMQPVATQDFIQAQTLGLRYEQEMEPERLAAWLVEQGYERVDQVDVVGEFAMRGGIVDIYSPDCERPVRVEFFGDEIDSLRFFDLDTQRSVEKLHDVEITGCRDMFSSQDGTHLLNYLPGNTIVALEEVTEVSEIGRITMSRLGDPRGYFGVERILQAAAGFDCLYLNRFTAGSFAETVRLKGQSVQRFENRGLEALEELVELGREQQVLFYCDKPAQRQRVEEIVRENLHISRIPDGFDMPLGYVHRGFELPEQPLLVISHHEAFGQHQPRRRIRKVQSTQAIETFSDLNVGDLVVHVSHGIGIFRGFKTLTRDGWKEEYLALEFAEKAMMHVPASKIELVHKYIGTHQGRPKLSKLGGKAWLRQKQKVAEAVEDMAAELIHLQAHRESMPGISFPEDTKWQTEFEETFPYQDTEDQILVNKEIKRDMHKPRPMDRLLCGDVGYGKTELALRAAFKAIESGRQVAVLVPTTVLAQQHYNTFRERMADFPFIVEVLSRFNTGKHAKDIIKRAVQGQVDVLIGTHRLLSEDVMFKDLGLVIIDEEQRFGVSHKERLKLMRREVDVLTMTATPIPRTLHMSLLGLRDISSLTTPPLDRRSIVTEVCSYEEERIRQIILREMARDGQVFFLHNRVHNIMSVADTVRQLVPEARVIVGHGQMSKRELEKTMLAFIRHEADVLVSTTIIESGLDIPNANTIIINDADRFGLAELHQLRGRVGRYKHRAYAFMLLPKDRAVNPTAGRRLKAIEEYSQLGSGFRIALRDLEIRGAGNILGAEQSGHIDAVGYELYCRLLSNSVERIRGSRESGGNGNSAPAGQHVPVPAAAKVQYRFTDAEAVTELDLGITCHIPRNYISSDRQRLDVYRRLAASRSRGDLEQLEKDLHDLFGKPPDSVTDLLQLAEIRILATHHHIRSISQSKPDLIFRLHDQADPDRIFNHPTGRVTVMDRHTVYLRLRDAYFDTPTTLLATLRKMLSS